jgi:hypothetical protein
LQKPLPGLAPYETFLFIILRPATESRRRIFKLFPAETCHRPSINPPRQPGPERRSREYLNPQIICATFSALTRALTWPPPNSFSTPRPLYHSVALDDHGGAIQESVRLAVADVLVSFGLPCTSPAPPSCGALPGRIASAAHRIARDTWGRRANPMQGDRNGCDHDRIAERWQNLPSPCNLGEYRADRSILMHRKG